ncbi:MAG: TetR/AcrR family transcriptional regulator C-terminal domain-containing protein [Minicystis sp.]
MSARRTVEAGEVKSRRERPAKDPLTRDAIVAAALDLLTREGIEAMSLRKVAAILDTGPASLYVYVANLQELQALVLDRALAGVELPAAAKGTWRERLDALLHAYLKVLYARPGLAQLAMTTIATGPNYLRLLETLLGLFDEAGLPPTEAAWAADVVTLYVTAIAAEKANWREQKFEIGKVARSLDAVSPEEFPRIHAAREGIMGGGGEARFTWALDVLVNGILKTPRPEEREADKQGAARRKTKGR